MSRALALVDRVIAEGRKPLKSDILCVSCKTRERARAARRCARR